MTVPSADAATGALRVAAVADADSFVKWAAALITSVPSAGVRLALVETPLTVSPDQQRAALAGSGFPGHAVTRMRFAGLQRWLRADPPDVLVVAGRGPFARLVMRIVDTVHPRPVTVMGLPGMAIPAQRGAAQYRREADLLVVHSRREQRAFGELSDRLGLGMRLGLATLPYARTTARPRGGTDLVFAAQALVPRDLAERRRMAEILRDAALADPDRRVVVKLRSRRERGEEETHLERAAYPDLLGAVPDNLVVSHEPMSAALSHAQGLVTVSSTAAVEAMAQGVPVIAVDTFGVRKTHLNTVFADSGVLGDAADVVARRFRHPTPEWRDDNYFHDEAEATWWAQVEELVERRRRGDLPARTVPAPRGGALHAAWHRKSVLGAHDRSVSGTVALAVGTPVVRSFLWARRRRGRHGAGTWTDDASDITLAPAPFQDSIRR
ncbi:DUF6716 putative glycosyltransferase [Microbacterium sp.]|uniref:DUF6716 putative glycosyltransferase n=1 Tax=Microbacterium sp. TaxID=51671 RepID=UPI00092588D0|nr:DUF6716 putative glycosyltransferase [Microbacterium sp.]MBN9187256.1 hypothetical protein [Microbacterium sp.]MBN9192237.1 hypothetical protein [Microbacterium sp.]OJU68828.1 MAG: hypothetical protein BGO04_12485 [Microbacterium sp. 70-38]